MELPFSLTERADGSLRYGIAVWYRILAVAIFGVLLFAIVGQEAPPSILGWILLALSALGVLYEERWTFGPEKALYRVGLIFAARNTVLPVGELSRLKLSPYTRGTVPGSQDETREASQALSGESDERFPGKGIFSGKKTYLLLILEAEDGTEYVIDRVPARRRTWILSASQKIAGVLGITLGD